MVAGGGGPGLLGTVAVTELQPAIDPRLELRNVVVMVVVVISLNSDGHGRAKQEGHAWTVHGRSEPLEVVRQKRR